jgi:cytochrome b involved in lipid metabolism
MEILFECGGQDATEDFEDVGHSQKVKNDLKMWRLGKVVGGEETAEEESNIKVIY